jgi:hypothetical protein
MFITLEDETKVANLIVRPSLLARQRRVILSAGMWPAGAGCSTRARSSTCRAPDRPLGPAAARRRARRAVPGASRAWGGGQARGGPDQRLTGSGASRGTSTSPTCGSAAASRSRPGPSGESSTAPAGAMLLPIQRFAGIEAGFENPPRSGQTNVDQFFGLSISGNLTPSWSR